MTYYENSNAPNFIMRMRNLTSKSDCCGISTLVNPNKIKWLSNVNQSFVDIYYFKKTFENCAAGQLYTHPITAMGFPDFKMNSEYLFYYNLTDDSERFC